MPFDSLIARFGLPAVAIGAGVEGEPFAIMGGLLAQHESFPLWAAMLAAIGGAACVDQFWFIIGRWIRSAGKARLARRMDIGRGLRMLERHSSKFILLFRFAYGIRAIAPVAIGASQVPARKYVPLEMSAAIVWGAGFTYLGYRYGDLIQSSHYASVLWTVSIGVLLVLTLAPIAYKLLDRRKPEENPLEVEPA